ncbi:MAG: hypothetical protein HY063_08025 [Bacteroidetes bacterium]|nr:hypothetical protein [Bacteroidota bacterium]
MYIHPIHQYMLDKSGLSAYCIRILIMKSYGFENSDVGYVLETNGEAVATSCKAMMNQKQCSDTFQLIQVALSDNWFRVHPHLFREREKKYTRAELDSIRLFLFGNDIKNEMRAYYHTAETLVEINGKS